MFLKECVELHLVPHLNTDCFNFSARNNLLPLFVQINKSWVFTNLPFSKQKVLETRAKRLYFPEKRIFGATHANDSGSGGFKYKGGGFQCHCNSIQIILSIMNSGLNSSRSEYLCPVPTKIIGFLSE